MIERHRGSLAAVVVVAMLAVACNTAASPSPTGTAASSPTGSGEPSAPTASDKRVVWATYETVDSAFATETDDAYILTQAGIGEMLTENNFDGELQAGLATEWERTGDLTWDFTLQEGVTFHDGTPFNAEAVANALTHLLEAEAPARSFNPNTFASVEASGESVVTITTVSPNALVPFYLASPNTLILAPKAYESDTIDPIQAGTGPFVMTSMNLPQSITLERNETYWDGQVALAGGEVRFIPDGGTRVTLLQTGEAHAANSLPIAAIPTLETDSNLTVIRGAQPRTNTLYLNNQKAPLDDVRVRQAIQAAIDTDALANVVLEGAVEPAIGPFAPTAAWAPAGAQPIARDLDKARSLLADAGIAEGSLTLGIWAYPGRPELPDVAVAIQGMLAEVGITAEVRVADYAALEPDVLAGNFDMMLLSRSYLTDINDPAGYLRSDYTCEGSYNLTHFCDEEVDAQLEEVIVNEDPSARYAVYTELAEKFHEEAIDVFLYHPQAIGANSVKLQNYQFHPMEHFVLTAQLSLAD